MPYISWLYILQLSEGRFAILCSEISMQIIRCGKASMVSSPAKGGGGAWSQTMGITDNRSDTVTLERDAYLRPFGSRWHWLQQREPSQADKEVRWRKITLTKQSGGSGGVLKRSNRHRPGWFNRTVWLLGYFATWAWITIYTIQPALYQKH